MASATTVDFTLSLEAAAYHAGDVLADTQELASALGSSDGTSELVSLTVLDEDDQTAAAMSFWFLESNQSIGTENAVPSITDANARKVLGIVTIPAAAWVDVGGAKVATLSNIGLLLTGAAGNTSLYMAVTTAGTPTQTGSGITGHATFIRY